MFRPMRRKRQELPQEMNIEILKRGETGVLALCGDDGYPYTVPINYIYDEEKIYFHGAKEGHKIDAIKNCNKASFCVIDEDEIKPEEYSTDFRSVVVFGKMRIINEPQEMRRIIEKVAVRFAPNDTKENREAAIKREFNCLSILELTPEHISGKEAMKLVRIREKNN